MIISVVLYLLLEKIGIRIYQIYIGFIRKD